MRVKTGLAEMLKGGVIMDVTNAEQARIAEDAGACAVMALERVPADIRREGGVARMADPAKIREIQEAVTIPVMAKARIGHFVEAQVLEALEVDYIDESEVLTPADEEHHIDKWAFTCRSSAAAATSARRCGASREGAAMIRTKGEAGTGDVVERRAPHALRLRRDPPARLAGRGRALRRGQGAAGAVRAGALGRRGRAGCPSSRSPPAASRRPADAALMMQLGADGVFVGSGIFKSGRPGGDGQGDRRGDDALPRRARCSRASRAGSASRCGPRAPRSRRKSCSRPAAGSDRRSRPCARRVGA